MEQIKEAVYLINDERYLHLRENGAGDFERCRFKRCKLHEGFGFVGLYS